MSEGHILSTTGFLVRAWRQQETRELKFEFKIREADADVELDYETDDTWLGVVIDSAEMQDVINWLQQRIDAE